MSMCMSRVGGIANVNRGSHELEFASASLVPMATNQIGAPARLVRDRQTPEPRLAEQQRMTFVQAALPHQRVRDRNFERLGQRGELGGRAGGQHAAAGVDHRPLRAVPARRRSARRSPDRASGRTIGVGVFWNAFASQVGREDVHRDVDEHRTRAARLRQMERALENSRQILDAIDAIHALAERPVDLHLARVVVEVHFLMRMASVEVGLDVARDDDHRNRVERGVRHAGRGVRQARARDATARRRACR